MSRQYRIVIGFILLNLLLFLPRFLLDMGNSSLFPISGFLEGSFYDRLKYIFNRPNYDFFRLSIDYFLFFVTGIYLLKKTGSGIYRWIVAAIYTLLLVYQVYFAFFEGLYKVDPLFYNDLISMRTAYGILWNSLGVWLIFAGIGIVGIFSALFWLNIKLFRWAEGLKFAREVRWLVYMACILCLVSLMRYKWRYRSSIAIQLQTASIVSNIAKSYTANQFFKNFNPDDLKKQNLWSNYQLNTKPNIYFIFIESYGEILWNNTELSGDYLLLLEKRDSMLNAESWFSSSHFSTAPVSGGISWISYGSLLFGFNMRDQGSYISLLYNEELNNYNHMLRYFKSQGYRNYRLSSIPDNQTLLIPWDDYTRFYSVDRWIYSNEMNYTGKLYGFGPCPPDQFSLNFAKDLINREYHRPFTLFFITQNSHTPFFSPEHLTDDWKALNDGTKNRVQRSVFMAAPKLPDYLNAIKYQLEYLIDFIIKRGSPNDLFIFVGDHQPAVFASKDDGFETPVHIISKDSVFLQGFREYGFEEGMLPDVSEIPIRHEGFYSLFFRELMKSYGEGPLPLPEYQSHGFELYKDEN